MASIEERVSAIESRNKRVELDKAWEVSWTRRLAITAVTYTVIVTFLFVTHHDNPFLNGLVPAVSFLLSTLALSLIKKLWQANHK